MPLNLGYGVRSKVKAAMEKSKNGKNTLRIADAPLRIGEVALASGVSRDALRFYEDEGLIRSVRAPNGYRHYPRETVDLVRYVRTAQRLGFSLAEIKDSVPKLWKMGNTETEVVRLLTQKLKMVDQRIQELRELRDELQVRLDTACANRLAEKVPGRAAPARTRKRPRSP